VENVILATFGAIFLGYSLLIRQLNKHEVTGPMFFVISGMLLALVWPDFAIQLKENFSYLLPVVELTLGVILFSDAARSRLKVLKHSLQYPSLLLFIALPLTIILGTLSALLLFDNITLIQAMLLALILSPTDAALSKGLLLNMAVPAPIREGINVESGLNDGLCVPLFLIFVSFAQYPSTAVDLPDIAILFVSELGIAILIAVVSIAVLIPLLNIAYARHYFKTRSSPFLLVGFIIFVFSSTQYAQGSGFIAAFVAGLLYARFAPGEFSHQLLKDSEYLADLIALLIWCLLGVVSIYLVLPKLNWPIVVYAALSATLIRMLPVMMSLLFTRLNFKERLTFAWFGPRGLASIVFTVMLLEAQIPGAEQVAMVAITTILFSVFIHGVSTNPIAQSYNKKTPLN
jgi:NhaP-type Na+/H+ or K+/H+ antiporter